MKLDLLKLTLKIARLLKPLSDEKQRRVVMLLADLAREEEPEPPRRAGRRLVAVAQSARVSAPPVQGKRWVPVAEAATILQLHKQKVRRMIRDGELKVQRLGPRKTLVEV